MRKLFPKATKGVYGAPGKARVCFLETADVRDALSVDGEVLDDSRLVVTAEHPEEVALEADKAAAGHEVFIKLHILECVCIYVYIYVHMCVYIYHINIYIYHVYVYMYIYI